MTQLPREVRMQTLAVTDRLDTMLADLVREPGSTFVGLINDATRNIEGFNAADDIIKQTVLKIAKTAIVKCVVEITTDEEATP